MSDLRDIYGNVDIDGGFHDLATFRAEMGADVAHLSDADARRMIDENLREKAKMTREQRADFDDVKDPDDYQDTVFKDMADNMRNRADELAQEKRRLAQELAQEKANRNANRSMDMFERTSLLNTQSKLRDELELEKMRRLYGDRFVWKSPGSLDDYLTKERLKREVKEELLDEKRKAKQQRDINKIWTETDKPRRRSPARAKHKPKPKSPRKPKSPTRAKSPKSKPKSKKK